MSSTSRHWFGDCVIELNGGHEIPDVPPQLQLIVSLPKGGLPFVAEKKGAGEMSFQVPPAPIEPQLAIRNRALTVPAGGTAAPFAPDRMATNVFAGLVGPTLMVVDGTFGVPVATGVKPMLKSLIAAPAHAVVSVLA